jgi:hypothetical protein
MTQAVAAGYAFAQPRASLTYSMKVQMVDSAGVRCATSADEQTCVQRNETLVPAHPGPMQIYTEEYRVASNGRDLVLSRCDGPCLKGDLVGDLLPQKSPDDEDACAGALAAGIGKAKPMLRAGEQINGNWQCSPIGCVPNGRALFSISATSVMVSLWDQTTQIATYTQQEDTQWYLTAVGNYAVRNYMSGDNAHQYARDHGGQGNGSPCYCEIQVYSYDGGHAFRYRDNALSMNVHCYPEIAYYWADIYVHGDGHWLANKGFVWGIANGCFLYAFT